MSDTPRTDAAWLKRADSPRRQCSEQLERELSAYQAEMPEAPKVWTPSLMEDHWHETNWVEATDYDALAKRWAGMTARNERLTSEAKAFQMNYRLACDAETKRLTVERDSYEHDLLTATSIGMALILTHLRGQETPYTRNKYDELAAMHAKCDRAFNAAISAGKEKSG